MSDELETVAKLIARTSSADEEEARTAALIACRMIRKHRLRIVHESATHAAASSAPSRATTNATPENRAEWWKKMLTEIGRDVAESLVDVYVDRERVRSAPRRARRVRRYHDD